MRFYFFIFLFFSMGLISSMYPGETQVFPNEMGIDNLVYAITGNSTPVFPVITINSSNITVYLPADMAPNNFSLVFVEEKTNTVVQTIHTGGGGGSSRTKYIYRNITKPVPIYTDVVKEVPVDRVVEKTITNTEPTNWWVYFATIIIGMIIAWIIWMIFLR